ncbi:uncharacterized protein JCM6883_000317 [Sporobolomyces salmoneus]|uniref:uncharacterized protein n=1 Tax=Sporobolomyces salmoneus TaxID=183962 RepID=UPI0031754BF7
MPTEIKDSFSIGPKCVIVADCDLRGEITIGSGTVLQPRCTLLALSGSIILGSNNIIEENVVIVNRLKKPLVIGDHNLFQVGARIESPRIGDWNDFGIRSRTSPHVSIESYCTIGAGCLVLPSPFPSPSASASRTEPPQEGGEDLEEISTTLETLPSNTHVFGSENRRRVNSTPGEGTGQGKALFVKHLEYLRETLPRFQKLRMF